MSRIPSISFKAGIRSVVLTISSAWGIAACGPTGRGSARGRCLHGAEVEIQVSALPMRRPRLIIHNHAAVRGLLFLPGSKRPRTWLGCSRIDHAGGRRVSTPQPRPTLGSLAFHSSPGLGEKDKASPPWTKSAWRWPASNDYLQSSKQQPEPKMQKVKPLLSVLGGQPTGLGSCVILCQHAGSFPRRHIPVGEIAQIFLGDLRKMRFVANVIFFRHDDFPMAAG